MADNLQSLFGLRNLRASPLTTMHVVMATRLSLLYAQGGRDPLPDLAVRLRSMRAAKAVVTLVATIERAWPEPFALHRPCCMLLSPDEALLAEIASAARSGNLRTAVDAMRDLLPVRTHEPVFRDVVELVAVIGAVRPDPAMR